MLSRTKILLSIGIVIGTTFAASAATEHHRVAHPANRSLVPYYNNDRCPASGGPTCSERCLPSGPPCRTRRDDARATAKQLVAMMELDASPDMSIYIERHISNDSAIKTLRQPSPQGLVLGGVENGNCSAGSAAYARRQVAFADGARGGIHAEWLTRGQYGENRVVENVPILVSVDNSSCVQVRRQFHW